jgi:hypothetical protein
MATLIYLPSSGAAPVTPSTWIFPNQINPVTYKSSTTKASTTMTTKTEATGTTSPTQRAMVRWVIGPLLAQSISGTVRAVIRSRESATGANAHLAIAIKIIQSTGSDRATLLGVTSADSATSPYELTTTLSSRRAWTSAETEPLTLTSQSASAGDYLVIEMGFRSATTTSRTIDLRLGDAAASNLTYGDAETNDYNGWVEFSQTINFQETYNLTVADATHTHTADNIDITQVHSLTVADAAHAHAADNIDITQVHVPAVEDAAHAHTADNLVITQAHSLTVEDATHTHTADNVTGISFTYQLAIDDAFHYHRADGKHEFAKNQTLRLIRTCLHDRHIR